MKKHLIFTTLFLFFIQFSFAQDCPLPEARQHLNGNNVEALITGGGSLFFDGNNAAFQVPASGQVHTIFAQGLWLGAIDPAGNLKLAAQTYGFGTGTSDYFAGPLDEAGAANSETCQRWDRIWTVYRYQVEAHIQDLSDNGAIDNPIPEIMGWPGKGNPHFSDIYGFELPSTQQGLAPFFDQDGDGLYDPLAGDYPMPPRSAVIPEQITWSIFNDAGNVHSESFAPPLQVEVQLTAWAFNCTDNPQLNNIIFTSYKLINRGPELLDSLHFGLWTDFDLGCYADDFQGSAPALNTIFAYNQDNEDDLNCDFGVAGYGENPPVQAITTLNRGLSYAMYNENGPTTLPGLGQPTFSLEIFHYLTGRWRDGLPLTYGGSGYDPSLSNPPTNFAFPGDPNNPDEWSAFTAVAVDQADRRSIGSIKLGQLAPGGMEEIDVAYSYFREPGANHLENVTAMYAGIENLQAWYDSQFEDICSQESICQEDCIWAGDANADGIANHCDLLAIAVGENVQGPTRSAPYNWSPQNGEDWAAVQSNGADYKHIDANGDGTIGFEDFLLTEQHYNLTRPDYQPPAAEYREGPELTLTTLPNQFDFDNLSAGQNTSLGRIRLTTDVPGLYALAFSIEYDTAYFEYIRSAQSGFRINDRLFATGANLPGAPGQFDFALAATNGAINSGVLTLMQLQTKAAFPDPLPSNTTQIRFKNIKAIQSDGTEIEIGGATIVATFPEIMVDTEEPQAAQNIQLFPNPTNGELELRFPGKQLEGIAILDVTGKLVWQQEKKFIDAASLGLQHLQSGIYFVRMQLGEAVVTRRVVLKK